MRPIIKCRVLKKERLTDAFDPRYIHSVVCTDKGFWGKSLVIAIRSEFYADIKRYSGEGPRKGGLYYIPLDKYTYHLPYYIALSPEQYKDVVIYTKEFEDDEGYTGRFIKARITKPVKF